MIKIKVDLFQFYEKNWKKLMAIPIAIFLLSTSYLIYHKISYGEFFQKDITLKGGIVAYVPTSKVLDLNKIKQDLSKDFEDVNVRYIGGEGYEIEMGYTDTKKVLDELAQYFEVDKEKISIGAQSPLVSEVFYQESIRILLISFLLMGIVLFISFGKNYLPALSIIFTTTIDIVNILALLTLLGFKVGIATIGALLMIIGYSSDSDVLVANYLWKRRDLDLKEGLKRGLKTEITMDVAALLVYTLMILSGVDTLVSLGIPLLFGIIFDALDTWLLGAALQRLVSKR